MKIKTPTEFLSFSDGICDIYNTSGNRPTDKVMSLCFGRRVIGVKRFYAARAATTEIDLLIHVPMQLAISANQNVVITGVRYKIEQFQHLYDSNPPATVLTLHKIGVTT